MDLQRLSDRSESGVEPFLAANFAAREAFRPAYDRVAEVLCATLDFTNAMDVGCGQGFLIDALLAKGVDVWGIELSVEARDFASQQARDRIAIGNALWANTARPFDLVTCVEMAEHIEPQHSARLAEKVAGMSDRYVYFTAAPPHQPGHGHINCRPTTDWLHFFSRCGWSLDLERTIDIRARLGILADAPWISMNTMLFVKE